MQARYIFCDPINLRNFLMLNSTMYIQLNDSGIPNFWQDSSKFLCGANLTTLSEIAQSFTTDFTLPENVRDVRKKKEEKIFNLL
jgi:hypothetical protein